MFAGKNEIWISADRRTKLAYNPGAGVMEVHVEGVKVSEFGGGVAEVNGAVGAATVTANEIGQGANNVSVLTLANFVGGVSGDNAALASGQLLYTFPAGIIVVDSAQMIAVGTVAAMTPTTDTPEIGLGTTQASGVTATLGAVATTAEDIFEGTAITDVAGTVFSGSKFPTAAVPLVIPAASAHTVYLNYADTWADVDAAANLVASGVVVLNWRKLT